ncbi:hypothetical protein BDM02DRAFT_3113594 [Thelephora ganbajun]|uniref:Uncharacterized protein n=1 Tax=Thelephora ganbajun TaxID=370292 RepID=A0ACB6ZIZ0_THEGA|nr:hypothetical protein BDM02DRAFT_3113594 [Thelephora ganbajun]
MPLGDTPAKFPDLCEDDSIPPPATRENPAIPSRSSECHREKEHPPHSYHGNPRHFQLGLKRLDNALNDVIALIEQEATNLGRTGNEDGLLIKFKGWRRELSAVRTGVGDRIGHRLGMGEGVPAELGGIFVD